MILILSFRSADDRDYDKFIQAPDHMSIAEAVPLADKTVAAVKATGDWQWNDIEEALEKLGFIAVGWAHCEQEV